MTRKEIAQYREMIRVRQREIEKALEGWALEEGDFILRALSAETRTLGEMAAAVDELEVRSRETEPQAEA